jgi:hypothetical protein
MNPEADYARELRLRAGRHLPADFALRVMRDARRQQRRTQRTRLTAITAALCIAIVLAAHWMVTARSERQNLEQWSKAAQQIKALEETI